jgi:hypothetical protein
MQQLSRYLFVGYEISSLLRSNYIGYATAYDSDGVVALQGPGKFLIDHDRAEPEQPWVKISYDERQLTLDGRYKDDQAYKFYVFVRVTTASGETKRALELYQIDGLMTTEEAAAYEAQQEAERRAAWEKERAERNQAMDERARPLARGYTYHGAAENGQSTRLFLGGALEEGHAYLITGFIVRGSGSSGGIIGTDRQVIVEYPSQRMRGEVVEASASSMTLFGSLGITVVIAGGSPPFHTPIVIGVVPKE